MCFVHHDGFIYDNSAPNLDICTHSEAVSALNKLERDAINYPEQHEGFERQKNKFKWICCDVTVTAGFSSGGCKKGKHGFDEETEGHQRTDGHLDREMITQWENERQHNVEYIGKWLLMLENQT